METGFMLVFILLWYHLLLNFIVDGTDSALGEKVIFNLLKFDRQFSTLRLINNLIIKFLSNYMKMRFLLNTKTNFKLYRVLENSFNYKFNKKINQKNCSFNFQNNKC